MFSEEHTLESSSNQIEHRFLPLIKDHSFKHPPPPSITIADMVFDHNAMLAFPQEKLSHYTTGILLCSVV